MRHARVVVIGGGFGGVAVTHALRRAPCDVTLIDRQNHHLFQPLLYQVATAGLSPANIAWPIRSIFRKDLRVSVLMADVSSIDPKAKVVHHSEGDISYDYLVIAAGAKNGWFGRPEWSASAVGLKSLADAVEIRTQLLTSFEKAEAVLEDQKRHELMTFVVIGGGPTGVEMAGAIAELGRKVLQRDFRNTNTAKARVILIELADRLLLSFHHSLGEYAKAQLEKIGVEVWLGTRVSDIRDGVLQTSRGEVKVGAVVWAAGVEAQPAARWLDEPHDRGGRVIVDSACRVPGLDGVFVIGDIARFEQEGQALPGVAPVAMQQGKYVAEVIANEIKGWDAPAPFEYKDPGTMATIGRSAAVAQKGDIRLTGFLAWMAWLVVHLRALMAFRNRLLVFVQWVFAYLTWQRGARLITRMRRE
jgi:NADH dehydrogenase